MTSMTFDPGFEAALESPVFDVPARPAGRLSAGLSARWASFTAERRELRAYRAQERALRDLSGSERVDALAAARR